MTSCPGLFAAGDVRNTDMYQVLSACADGARAAKYCAEFLEEKNHFEFFNNHLFPALLVLVFQ